MVDKLDGLVVGLKWMGVNHEDGKWLWLDEGLMKQGCQSEWLEG